MAIKKKTRPKLDSNTGLAPRDIEIIELMNVFGGKMYTKVLAKTFFYDLAVPEQQARDRVQKLKSKYGLFRYVPTGLMSPRNTIMFSDLGKRTCIELGLEPKNVVISATMVNHLMLEMVTMFWLRKAGRVVTRTVPIEWKKDGHRHTPDLIYYKNPETKEKMVYVEVETNKKQTERYLDIFGRMIQDEVDSALYVFEDEKKMTQFARVMPIWDRLFFTTIDRLIAGVVKNQKIDADSQEKFLAGLDEKKKKEVTKL